MLASLFSPRHIGDLITLLLVAMIQTAGLRAILAGPAAQAPKAVRSCITGFWIVSLAVLAGGFLMQFVRIYHVFPRWFRDWGPGFAMVWAFFSVLLLGAYMVTRMLPAATPQHSPARRSFLLGAKTAILAAPAAVTSYAMFIQRFDIRLREIDLAIPGLPKDLDGLRIAQLTDIHLSPFLSVSALERAVAIANEAKPNLILVTGDLITTKGDPVDDCLNTLAKLKSDAGIFGCMGNHEIYANSEAYTKKQGARLGMNFLRHEAQALRFGDAMLNIAGVDYQHFGRPYLRRAEELVVPGALNVLLSHNPDVFPVAAHKGFPLTISGHTHGGQVRVEILHEDLNVARFFTPYVDGVYRQGNSSIFVSRGIGTIGLPARLGAPPEVALLRLCRT